MGMDFILEELKSLDEQSLRREYKTLERIQGPVFQIDGKSYLSFCSNNYLGLADHSKIQQAVVAATGRYGWGVGASRLVSGNTAIHRELEKKIAEFKNTEDALVFPTGYMANMGALCALAGKEDVVIGDKLNHASIVDGCRQSGATFRVYPHNDVTRLETLLQRSAGYRRRLVVTDSVFSMDGDVAPLPEIARVAKKHDAMLMVDDAHATGVFGNEGKGLVAHYGLEGEVDVLMGSLSKAVGSMGGFIAGSRQLIDYLKNKARPFLYTTALPPAVCAASLAGLSLIREESFRIGRLWENVAFSKSRLSALNCSVSGDSPIVPLIVGPAEDALALSEKLFQDGIIIPAIRPPTVPKGTSRLRVSLMATHTKDDINRLVDTLKTSGFCGRNAGVYPPPARE